MHKILENDMIEFKRQRPSATFIDFVIAKCPENVQYIRGDQSVDGAGHEESSNEDDYIIDSRFGEKWRGTYGRVSADDNMHVLGDLPTFLSSSSKARSMVAHAKAKAKANARAKRYLRARANSGETPLCGPRIPVPRWNSPNSNKQSRRNSTGSRRGALGISELKSPPAVRIRKGIRSQSTDSFTSKRSIRSGWDERLSNILDDSVEDEVNPGGSAAASRVDHDVLFLSARMDLSELTEEFDGSGSANNPHPLLA
jgi:hypothetical protein